MKSSKFDLQTAPGLNLRLDEQRTSKAGEAADSGADSQCVHGEWVPCPMASTPGDEQADPGSARMVPYLGSASK